MLVTRMRVKTLMIVVALAAIPLGVMEWTVELGHGSRTLLITFVVIDAESSRPIPGATLEIEEEYFGSPVTIATCDENGEYRRQNQVRISSRGNWRKTKYSTSIPQISFQASAPGYQKSEMIGLNQPEFREAVKIGDPLCTLEVRIRLQKTAVAQPHRELP